MHSLRNSHDTGDKMRIPLAPPLLRIQKRAMHAYLYWMAAPSRLGPGPETIEDTELVAYFL